MPCLLKEAGSIFVTSRSCTHPRFSLLIRLAVSESSAAKVNLFTHLGCASFRNSQEPAQQLQTHDHHLTPSLSVWPGWHVDHDYEPACTRALLYYLCTCLHTALVRIHACACAQSHENAEALAGLTHKKCMPPNNKFWQGAKTSGYDPGSGLPEGEM